MPSGSPWRSGILDALAFATKSAVLALSCIGESDGQADGRAHRSGESKQLHRSGGVVAVRGHGILADDCVLRM